jgi:hypothetical protein
MIGDGLSVEFFSRQKVSGQIATVLVPIRATPSICFIAIQWKNEHQKTFPESSGRALDG